MSWVIVIVAVVAVVGLIVWFVRAQHPEKTASHSDVRDTNLGTQLYGDHPSGPAGPDLESQDPNLPGSRGDSLPPRQ